METDLTGDRLFFRCGHERTPDNLQPNGMQHGKPKVRCRACYNEREKERWKRRAPTVLAKRKITRQRKPRITMRDRIAELERENEILRTELNLMVDALLKERAHNAPVGRNAKRHDPEEGRGPKDEHAVTPKAAGAQPSGTAEVHP